MKNQIESGHGLLYLSQIVEPAEKSNTSKSSIDAISKSLADWGFNFALPVVCLSNEEEKYQLLTGLPIYEAAKKAELKQIWVFLIALNQQDAEKVIEQVQLQSSLNEQLIGSVDLDEFRSFLSNDRSRLTEIPGIKVGYAKLIKEKRPFASVEDMQKKLGVKRCANWLKAYKKVKPSLIS
jgi:hypothetical protein